MENVIENESAWERRTSALVKLSKLDEGATIIGVFLNKKLTPIKDRATGIMKEVDTYVLEHLETKEKIQFLGDSGFNREFAIADIHVNDIVKIVKGKQMPLANGKRVNTYEIFVKPVQTKLFS